MALKDNISSWIKDRVSAAGCRGCVVGLSGGIDSAVVAVLCKKVFPKNIIGILMPCHSHKEDLKHATELARAFDIETQLVDLTLLFESAYMTFEGKTYSDRFRDLATANIKPRLRMMTLYYYANNMNYMVIGTGNKSELMMGYFTKYGDGGVDLLPLGDLLKSEVRQLAKELKIAESIINRPPSAGLWPGQTDEGEMGITYDELDNIVLGKTDGIDSKKVKMVQERISVSEHKRCGAPVFKR
ncbi:MAG: NAD(+) synthase [Candidatus Saganbacteria bacterium]|nr:NAD(+) synthase [Candidatus Saganbacteria bacterium]